MAPHRVLLAIAAPSASARNLAQTIESTTVGSAAHRGAETAIDAGDQPLAVDHVGVAQNALRHEPRMLDEIGRRIDDAGNEDLVVGNFDRS